ncbi:MAG: RtcB family protein, partial [Erysipelotrichaceae bacterium]|nr:RtcB family protein [Erysipelotrichaceae bacterium]
MRQSARIKNWSFGLNKEIERACFQVGTLGGGNHFIELQRDENDRLGIMVHSGSRNLGFTLCNFFNKKAKALNSEWHSPLPSKWDLAYLPIDSEAGEAYIQWMQFALDFAAENRERILDKVMVIIRQQVQKHAGHTQFEITEHLHCHHNYASLETHNGKNLWIHRKGAIRVDTGEAGIIPGAMGSYSYLVRGKGSIDSFNSCSHGAGRMMSRKAAKEKFGVQETIGDLNALGVYLGKVKTADLGEESRQAYKNIDDVINNELDLIEPVRKLKTLAVVKG